MKYYYSLTIQLARSEIPMCRFLAIREKKSISRREHHPSISLYIVQLKYYLRRACAVRVYYWVPLIGYPSKNTCAPVIYSHHVLYSSTPPIYFPIASIIIIIIYNTIDRVRLYHVHLYIYPQSVCVVHVPIIAIAPLQNHIESF